MQVTSADAKREDTQSNHDLSCVVKGIGAWGPGICSWSDLAELLMGDDPLSSEFINPKPAIIPSNELRRAPIQVRMAVETSLQATQAASLPSKDVACVFGSGIGDTEITDYLCRALTTDEKQLSPTKFHNSVHNAAAGYWTISTGCMKSANSISGFFYTAGIALFDAMIQVQQENQPVLITLFDTKTYGVHGQLHTNPFNFSVSVLLSPVRENVTSGGIVLSAKPPVINEKSDGKKLLGNSHLLEMYEKNPAARILVLLEKFALLERNSNAAEEVKLDLSDRAEMLVSLERVK